MPDPAAVKVAPDMEDKFEVDVGEHQDVSEHDLSDGDDNAPLLPPAAEPGSIHHRPRARSRRPRKSSCRIFCEENKVEICLGTFAFLAIICAVLAFVCIPSKSEESMADAARAHQKRHHLVKDLPTPREHTPEHVKAPPSSAGDQIRLKLGAGYRQHKISVFDPDLQFQVVRDYVVYTPPNVQQPKTPVVILFQAQDASFKETSRVWGMDSLADEEGFLVAYPISLTSTTDRHGRPGSNPGRNGWNALGMASASNNTCVTHGKRELGLKLKQKSCKQSSSCTVAPCTSDTTFVSAMIDEIVDKLSVDKLQVHLAGHGIGGMMAEQCAVTLGTKIASVVQVSGAPLTGFNSLPAAPVSLLSIRGRSDSVIPATTNVAKNTDKSICPQGCDTEGLVSNNGLYYVPEVDVARTWAVGARCSELESRDWVPTVQLPNSNISFNHYFSKIHGKCTRYGLNCNSDAVVVSCMVDAGHSLPWRDHAGGHSRLSMQLWSRFAWSFMADHPK